jgi:hypothetical protein
MSRLTDVGSSCPRAVPSGATQACPLLACAPTVRDPSFEAADPRARPQGCLWIQPVAVEVGEPTRVGARLHPMLEVLQASPSPPVGFDSTLHRETSDGNAGTEAVALRQKEEPTSRGIFANARPCRGAVRGCRRRSRARLGDTCHQGKQQRVSRLVACVARRGVRASSRHHRARNCEGSSRWNPSKSPTS